MASAVVDRVANKEKDRICKDSEVGEDELEKVVKTKRIVLVEVVDERSLIVREVVEVVEEIGRSLVEVEAGEVEKLMVILEVE